MTLILEICEFFAIFYLIHFNGMTRKESVYSKYSYYSKYSLANNPGNYKQDKVNKEVNPLNILLEIRIAIQEMGKIWPVGMYKLLKHYFLEKPLWLASLSHGEKQCGIWEPLRVISLLTPLVVPRHSNTYVVHCKTSNILVPPSSCKCSSGGTGTCRSPHCN